METMLGKESKGKEIAGLWQKNGKFIVIIPCLDFLILNLVTSVQSLAIITAHCM